MTALPPDPDPERTPGLEQGGGVRPGDTPPESASATSGLSHRDPPPRRRLPVWTAVFVILIVLLVLGLVVAQVTGLIGMLW